ncbi:tRNA lysidine(34) synthetase TilS [Rhizobium sp. SL86]|uniref:tRNA lysidine(34) synthetase TilS n=1 Tax=Rhizobium sp. SL86 TaxID=2995148 RepID=UPI002274B6C9|nr:tRNA lysidine(34) synthetase TilS [Rhizobium sp. SL86]MCY1666221.1 tRNA lysidine(34) synthetase TilS [Rhizobium sp. SL86]
MIDPAQAHAPSPLPPVEAIERFLVDLAKPARILVAVSGGSDSLGLLFLLQRCAATCKTPVDLLAVTIDHALRPQSAVEAREVSRICQSLAIRHITDRWEGVKPASGLSAAAREARYDRLCRVALTEQASLIVTGHTLDDQIETVLMRAGRPGSEGSIGLAGMAPSVLVNRSIWLHRPLLSARRQAIRDCLSTAGIGWIEDPSNTDPRFERARIRAGLTLDDEAVRGHIAQISKASAMREGLSMAAAHLFEQHLTLHRGVAAELFTDMLQADEAVWMHALSALTSVIGGRSYGPSRDSLARLADFLATGRPGRMTVGRVVFDRRRDRLYLVRESRNLPELAIAAGGTVAWDGRFSLENVNDGEVVIRPCPADRAAASAAFPTLPGSLALQAYRSLPDIIPQEMAANGRTWVRPLLAPYDRFLPQFDLKLAVSLAKQAGLDEFPPSPLNVFMRKT